MIADYADKLNSYEEFKDYADMVQQFIKRQKEMCIRDSPYTVVFAPFMYMLAEIIVRTCINIRNAFKEYKEGGKES